MCGVLSCQRNLFAASHQGRFSCGHLRANGRPSEAKKRGSKSVAREVVRFRRHAQRDVLLDAKATILLPHWSPRQAQAPGRSLGRICDGRVLHRDGGPARLLARLRPCIIVPDAVAQLLDADVVETADLGADAAMLSPVGDIASKAAGETIRQKFGLACHDALAGEGRAVNLACAHILSYFEATQYDTPVNLAVPQIEADAHIMALDAATHGNQLNRTLAGARGVCCMFWMRR